MVKLSLGDTAIAEFTNKVSNYRDTQCSIQSVNAATCNLGQIEISSCNNLKIGCCNDANVSLLSCASSFIFSNAVASVIDVTSGSKGNENTPAMSSLRQKLANYLQSSAVSAKDYADTTSSITSQLSTYFKSTCNAQEVMEQTVAIPALKGNHCSSNVVAMFNRSDVVLRCAMGAISQLLPTDNAAQEYKVPPLPWYHLTSKTKKYLIVMSCVLGAFIVLLILASISDLDVKD
jgi:hypothetical protein